MFSFQAQITSQYQTQTQTDQNSYYESSYNYWWWWSYTGGFSASATSTQTQDSLSFTDQYTLNLTITAVQDDLPGGMAKVLQMLQQGFVTTSVPKGNGTSTSHADDDDSYSRR